jgi:hypothetical protein
LSSDLNQSLNDSEAASISGCSFRSNRAEDRDTRNRRSRWGHMVLAYQRIRGQLKCGGIKTRHILSYLQVKQAQVLSQVAVAPQVFFQKFCCYTNKNQKQTSQSRGKLGLTNKTEPRPVRKSGPLKNSVGALLLRGTCPAS